MRKEQKPNKKHKSANGPPPAHHDPFQFAFRQHHNIKIGPRDFSLLSTVFWLSQRLDFLVLAAHAPF
jgi:hypothetical protein